MTIPELKSIWQENKADFIKFYSQEQRSILPLSKLEQTFIDLDGVSYYRFPQGMSLPLERLGELQGFATWMSSGISGEEFDSIILTMNEILSNGIKKPETAAQMGALIHVMKERRSMIFHTELMYNYVAVQMIREDESPEVYNNEIQLEKVAMFKRMVKEGGSYFFFHKPQLPIPTTFLALTEQEWVVLWEESELIQKNLKPIMDLILRAKKYSGKGKILQSN